MQSELFQDHSIPLFGKYLFGMEVLSPLLKPVRERIPARHRETESAVQTPDLQKSRLKPAQSRSGY